MTQQQQYGDKQQSPTPYAEKPMPPKQPRVQMLGRGVKVEGTMPDPVTSEEEVSTTVEGRSTARLYALVSLALILSGTMVLVAGVAWWISPAVAMVVAGVILLAVGVFFGFNN